MQHVGNPGQKDIEGVYAAATPAKPGGDGQRAPAVWGAGERGLLH